MSRTYNKVASYSWHSTRRDKLCRQQYHKADRRKTRNLLRTVESQWVPDDEEIKNRGTWDCWICQPCLDTNEELLYEEGFFGDVPFKKYMEQYPSYKSPNYCSDICTVWYDYDLTIDKVITKGKDYSLPCSDKWDWASDGGTIVYSLNRVRREFTDDVFGVKTYDCRETLWQDYLDSVDDFTNTRHPTWTVTLFYKKTDPMFGDYDFSHCSIEFPYSKKKPEFKLPDDGWYRYSVYKHTLRAFSMRETLDWLFRRGQIPLNFKDCDELVRWLKRNNERIVRSRFRMNCSK